jgi:hypothetical protein
MDMIESERKPDKRFGVTKDLLYAAERMKCNVHDDTSSLDEPL